MSANRIERGRAAVTASRSLLQRVSERYRVDPGVIVGIWGLESNFGTNLGSYNVIEALATLAKPVASGLISTIASSKAEATGDAFFELRSSFAPVTLAR